MSRLEQIMLSKRMESGKPPGVMLSQFLEDNNGEAENAKQNRLSK